MVRLAISSLNFRRRNGHWSRSIQRLRWCRWVNQCFSYTESQFSGVIVHLGQRSLGSEFAWVRVLCGQSLLGSDVYWGQFSWVRGHWVRIYVGRRSTWVRVRWGQSRSTGVSLLGSEFSGDRVYLGQRSTGVSLLGWEDTGSEFTWVRDLLGSEFAWVRVLWGQSLLGLEIYWSQSLFGTEFSGVRVYLG